MTLCLSLALLFSVTGFSQTPALVQDFGQVNPLGLFPFVHQGQTYYGIQKSQLNEGMLWLSDGTPGGTIKLKDWPQHIPSYFYPNGGSQDVFFLLANDTNARIGFTDGTTAGTTESADLGPGALVGETVAAGGFRWLSFEGPANSGYRALICTDGTPSGTMEISNWTLPGPWPALFHTVSGQTAALYMEFDYLNRKHILWRAGTSPGSNQVLDTLDYNPQLMGEVRGRMVYKCYHNGFWSSDGTTAGTDTLLYIPGTVNKHAYLLPGTGEMQLFSWDSAQKVLRVYASDGTRSGTKLISTVPCQDDQITQDTLDGLLYFSVKDPLGGYKLYRTDGTSTVFLESLQGQALGFHHIGGKADIWFEVRINLNSELWKTNGQPGGASQVVNLNARLYSTPIFPFQAYGIEYSLSVQLPTYANISLYGNDGTQSGFQQLFKFSLGGPYYPHTIGNLTACYFIHINEQSETELWKSDGTKSGTSLVATFHPGTPSEWEVSSRLGDKAYYIIDTYYDLELWESDGSTSGTIRLKDFMHGAGYFHQMGPPQATDVYFIEITDSSKAKLWRLNQIATHTQGPALIEEPVLAGNPGAELQVRLPESWLQTGPVQLQVFDMKGRLLQDKMVREELVTDGISGLAQGAYLVRLRRADGKSWSGRWLKLK